tara:strand:+ start:459 stop:2033 length:1575 start_codon:yes stop_codon:yes gene_type:complete
MAVTSLGYQVNRQPIAQSFFINEPNGIYCTQVDLFFAAKDASLPVQIQLRPMVNGFPSSSKIIPGTIKSKAGSDVNVDTVGPALTATEFKFDEPVFLKGSEDYALVVIADSKDYEIYVAEIDQFQVGSSERRAAKQPDLGNLFYSQNGVTWLPSMNEDLSFVIHQAKFKHTSATAILHNASVPKKKLVLNPVKVTSGDATVTMAHVNSGLQVGNAIEISGVDASVGGISAGSINGRRTITKVDFTGYTFEADSAADSDAIGGGANVLATKNIPFSLIYPNSATIVPRATSLGAGIKTTTGKSYAGSETAFQKSPSFNGIKLNQNNLALEPYIIAFDSAETDELGSGVKSFDMRMLLASNDSNVSPMIDLQRTSITLVDNLIDKQDPASSTGFNIPINFVNETSATGGSSAAKHLTRIVTLDTDAVGLKVLLSANRPNGTDFQLYFRTGTADEVITEKSFTLQEPETTLPTDENPNTFREYRYLIGGQNGVLPAFTKFQVKIVFRSTNSASVPRITDLRIIALSV